MTRHSRVLSDGTIMTWSFDGKQFWRSFWWAMTAIAAWHHVGFLVFLFICFAEVRLEFAGRRR